MDAFNELTYYHLPRDTATPESSTSTSMSPRTDKGMSVGLMPLSPGDNLINSRSSDSSQGGVDDLTKIARVIKQFINRYHHQEPQRGAGWARTTRLVEPMRASLRVRIQSVMHEAAGRMLI
jgi:hypothetical protein